MVRRYLGHMTDPRSRRTNHKAQVLLAHAHWAPGCHADAITEAGKTARGWIEKQVSSNKNSAEVRAGTCQIQVPAPHLPKGQQSS
ncbi:unnamed protein product, partial [Staurois parvus]